PALGKRALSSPGNCAGCPAEMTTIGTLGSLPAVTTWVQLVVKSCLVDPSAPDPYAKVKKMDSRTFPQACCKRDSMSGNERSTSIKAPTLLRYTKASRSACSPPRELPMSKYGISMFALLDSGGGSLLISLLLAGLGPLWFLPVPTRSKA